MGVADIVRKIYKNKIFSVAIKTKPLNF